MQAHEVLGVSPTASRPEVTEAFRRFAFRHHPDRGGDAVRFQAGVDAYHRLTGTGTGAAPAAPPGPVVFYRRRRGLRVLSGRFLRRAPARHLR